MDAFSLIVLEDTLELAEELLPSERVLDCVSGIRNCMDQIVVNPDDNDFGQKLREALVELCDIAQHHHKFIIVSRLKSIVDQFNVPDVA